MLFRPNSLHLRRCRHGFRSSSRTASGHAERFSAATSFGLRSIGPTFHAAASASAPAPRAPAGSRRRAAAHTHSAARHWRADERRRRPAAPRRRAAAAPSAKLPDGHAAAFDRHVDGRTHQRIAERRGDAIRQHAGVVRALGARAGQHEVVALDARGERMRRRRRRGRPAPRPPGRRARYSASAAFAGRPHGSRRACAMPLRELAAGFERGCVVAAIARDAADRMAADGHEHRDALQLAGAFMQRLLPVHGCRPRPAIRHARRARPAPVRSVRRSCPARRRPPSGSRASRSARCRRGSPRSRGGNP